MRTAFIIVLGCALRQWSPAQQLMERPEPIQQPVFFEAVRLCSSDSSHQRVDVQFRIGESFFIAVRNADTSFPFAFKRSGEVLVELTDSLTGTVNRDLDQVLMGSDSEEPAAQPQRWYQGVLSFSLRPGIYTINFEVTDHESHRDFSDRHRKVRLLKPEADPLVLSEPMFIGKPEGQDIPAKIIPVNFGGESVFGAPTAVLLELNTAEPDSMIHVRSSVISIPSERGEPPEVSISDSFTVAPAKECQLTPEKTDNQISYAVVRGVHNAPSLLVIPFPGSKLLLRTYTMLIVLRQGKTTREITSHFRLIWPDMPQSLKDVDYALDILRYITTPSLLDSLRKGGYEERRKNLEAFWKEKDETPGTTYNEVMAEYYRRVDHAMRSFGTLRVPDGAKSDRGRIYILYGPPSRTRRTLDPNSAFEEVWIYDHLKREFTFVDKNRNGTYELTETASK